MAIRKPAILRKIGVALATTALAGTALAGCSSSSGGSGSSPSPTGLPGGAQQTSEITLSSIQPNDGPTPVANYIGSANKSLDIYMYEFEYQYKPIVNALAEAKKRGVKIRVLLSLREVGQKNKTNKNHKAAEYLNKLGIDTQFSRPEFYVSHAKAIIKDAGEADQSVMICDFNVGSGYFGGKPEYPTPGEGGTRGMAVIDTNKQDVENVSATFNADWPPYSTWPAATRPNLIWAPSGEKFQPPGNAATATFNLIDNAQETIDMWVQEVNPGSSLVSHVVDRAKAGVKIRMITNAKGINPDAFTQLSGAGVTVVNGPADPKDPSVHLFIHCKTILVDTGTDKGVSMIGSLNVFADSSLYTERELDGFMTDKAGNDKVQALFDHDFSTATPYTG